MKQKLDIRWIQRLATFLKVYDQLKVFVEHGALSKMEEQGLIKAFEYTYELAWNTIKDFYESQGEVKIQGSKDAFRLAFKRGLIREGDTWMDMVQSRIQTAHTYDAAAAREVVDAIVQRYFPLFSELKTTMESLR